MGFPTIYYCVLLPKPLGILAYFFGRIKLAASLSIAYIGLRPPVEDRVDVVDVELDLYLLPSLSKEPPSTIKSALRVVEFASFRRGSAADVAECAVCMGGLEAGDEVRELGRCSHAFHKGCIDRWVDLGQVTCPLCRAHLLPKEWEEREACIQCSTD